MVDAARQMLDELMGRNRNLHPSEAGAKVNWEDPEFCQFYNVKFCPHDLFINTRADLGPCARIHDEEARHLYEDARPSQRKRQYEDEFLRFCNVMLHDVDRKIQKGKQRLLLMQRDQPNVPAPLSRHQEQLSNLTARINKLLSEAEEAGIRGDVDQAQDLMTLCEELKEEKEQLVQQYEANHKAINSISLTKSAEDELQQQPRSSPVTNPSEEAATTPLPAATTPDDAPDAAPSSAPAAVTPTDDAGEATGAASEDKTSERTDSKAAGWSHDAMPEKQMKVCEICGAFLIVGDAQQRIEDHLMGKQHLGYSKLRNAVAEINEARQKEREQEERRRREGRVQRFHSYDSRREPRNEYRERSRDYVQNRQPSDRRHHHHKSHHSSHHSYSRSGGGGVGVGGGGGGGGSSRSNRSHHNHNHNHYRHDSRERHCRSRSRSRY
ncbi:luc7-like protein 3 [Drosophila simulans]|uniref:luc7-like protein 3 n=1 Tax=Drosophila simulans TaxID=7240 RepID=UPI00192CE7C5|nr:luc7-like protein 3 [Drosophila simulans]